jgi:hypothetical protein
MFSNDPMFQYQKAEKEYFVFILIKFITLAVLSFDDEIINVKSLFACKSMICPS